MLESLVPPGQQQMALREELLQTETGPEGPGGCFLNQPLTHDVVHWKCHDFLSFKRQYTSET